MFTTERNGDFTPADPSSRLIWIDLELAGLDHEKDPILEIVCAITDADLNIIATGPDLVIHQPNEVLEKMKPWCQETHRKTGLYAEVQKSTLTVSEAEERELEFVRKYAEPRTCPLAGNTVHMDRLFLAKYMPALEQYLHPQIVDVTSFKEMCRRWCPDLFANVPEKKLIHRAGPDIEESIQEFKYYKSVLFDLKKTQVF